MTKKEFNIYLEEEDFEKLKQKAEQGGFTGRGGVSHYLKKIADEDLIFLDSNAKKILKVLGQK